MVRLKRVPFAAGWRLNVQQENTIQDHKYSLQRLQTPICIFT